MRPTICLPALRFVMEQQSWERLLFNWCVCLRVGFEEQEEVQSILAKPVGQKLVVRILQETSEHCIIQRVYDILLSATMYGTQIPKFPPHLNFIEKGRLKKNWHSRKKLTRSPCPNNHLIPPPPPHKLYLAVSQLLSPHSLHPPPPPPPSPSLLTINNCDLVTIVISTGLDFFSMER